jgi:hypothetical protein
MLIRIIVSILTAVNQALLSIVDTSSILPIFQDSARSWGYTSGFVVSTAITKPVDHARSSKRCRGSSHHAHDAPIGSPRHGLGWPSRSAAQPAVGS